MTACKHKKAERLVYGRYSCAKCGADLTPPERVFEHRFGRRSVEPGDEIRVTWLGRCRWLYAVGDVHCITEGTDERPTKRIRFVRSDRVSVPRPR